MPRRRATIYAWVLSIALHAGLACLLLRDDFGEFRSLPTSDVANPKEAPPAEFEFSIAIERTAEAPTPHPVPVEPPATGRRPREFSRPVSMPNEMSQLIRDLGHRPAERVAVQDIAPIEYREPAIEPISKPAVTPKPSVAVAKPSFGVGRAVHGELAEGKSVVYLLDRSTSMGLVRENFDAARAALFASVDSLPVDTAVQVLAYNGRVTRIHAGKDLVKKSPETSARLERVLGELAPEGESRHETALRAALALNADCVIWFTDATDEELERLAPILKGHPRIVSVSVARVNSGKIEPLRSLR